MIGTTLDFYIQHKINADRSVILDAKLTQTGFVNEKDSNGYNMVKITKSGFLIT